MNSKVFAKVLRLPSDKYYVILSFDNEYFDRLLRFSFLSEEKAKKETEKFVKQCGCKLEWL